MESKWVKMVGFCRVYEVTGKTWNGPRGSLLTRERVGWPRVEWRTEWGQKERKWWSFGVAGDLGRNPAGRIFVKKMNSVFAFFFRNLSKLVPELLKFNLVNNKGSSYINL